MKKPIGKPVTTYRTLAEFAKALRISTSTASGWTKHPLWKWNRKAPWPAEIVPDVLRWKADELQAGRPVNEAIDPAQAETIRGLREQKLREEIRKLRAQASVAESELAERQRRLIPIEEVERAGVSVITASRNVWLGMSGRMCNTLAHRDAAEIQTMLDEEIRHSLENLARGFRELGK
jgi:hypothetical protein